MACRKHSKFKSFGRRFIEFWHGYFQSTGRTVRDLPIKHFLSAVDIVKLCELSACTCKDLVDTLFPASAFICNYCQQSFATISELNVHSGNRELSQPQQQQHQQQRKQFQCVFCAAKLKSKNGLIRHMELHTREYECQICKKPIHAYDVDRHNTSRDHLRLLEIQSQQNHSETIN